MNNRPYNKNMKQGDPSARHQFQDQPPRAPISNNYHQTMIQTNSNKSQMNPHPIQNNIPHNYNMGNPHIHPHIQIQANQITNNQQPYNHGQRNQRANNNQRYPNRAPIPDYSGYQMFNPVQIPRLQDPATLAQFYHQYPPAQLYAQYPSNMPYQIPFYNLPPAQVLPTQMQGPIPGTNRLPNQQAPISNDIMTTQPNIDNNIKLQTSQTQPIQSVSAQTNRKKTNSSKIKIQDPTTMQVIDLNEIVNRPIDKNINQQQKPQQIDNNEVGNKLDDIKMQPASSRKEDNKDINTDLNNDNLISKDKLINDQNKNVDIQQSAQQSQINQQAIPPKQESPDVLIVDTNQNKTLDSKLPLDKPIEKSLNTQHPVKQETLDNTSNTSPKDDDKQVNKNADAQMINLEEQIDKLKINDTPVAIKQIDESKTVKSLNTDVSKDKPIVDNTNEQKPLIKKDQTVSNSFGSQQQQQQQQQQQKLLIQQQIEQRQQQQEQLLIQQHDLNKKIQSSQPASTATPKPQQQTSQTQQVSNDNKKSSLEGPQSKSTGNITYEIEFLKKFQYSNFSIEKPNFGNLNGKVDIFLNEPRPKNESGNDMFEPMYLRPNSNNRNLMGHRSMQLGPRMNSENKVPRKIISTSLSQDVKLRTTENAWKPDFHKNANEESTESLIKRARGLLNKLTPQNFEKISKQFLDLEVNTGEKLNKLIELIFDKATDEPAFIEQYTQLTNQMSKLVVEDKSNGETYKFNTLLLEACQRMFEGDKYKDLNLDVRQKKIDECEDKETKQQLIDELDEEKRLIRKKSLGNIKLIGSLYKIGRLKENIMDSCIDHLLNENDEDSIECLCSLLRSIGEKFEKSLKQNNRQRFNNQMSRLDGLVKEGKLPSRIRFLIMDVLDMRKDNWKPRKLQDVNKPKTIEEIHQDLKQKEEQSNREMSQLGNRRNDSIKKKNDNWMMSGSRKSQSNNDALNSINNLRKLTEQRTSDNSPNLGPLGPKSFGSWSQGASANKTLANTSQDRKINQWQQRQDDKSQQTPVKTNPFRGRFSPNDEMKEMELIKQHSSNLKSYIKSGSTDELIESIYSNSTEDSTHLFVRAAIDNACESLLKNLNDIGELLTDLVIKRKIISYSQFHLGLKFHLDSSLDILPDIPLFYDYIGRLLSPFYLEISDNERRSFFKDALAPCLHLELENDLIIIASLLKHAISIKGAPEVAKKWSVAKLSFDDFSKKQSEQEAKEFLKKCKLIEFVNELDNCKLLSEKSDLANQILNSQFNDIPKLLEKNLSPTDKELNKKLISALIEKCILDSTERKSEDTIIFKKDIFENKLKSLTMINFEDNDYQLEVIYTAVKVDNDKKKPKDFLLNIFHFLYDIKLIKGETFLNWVNDNRKDVPGNSVAIISLKRFVDGLQKENDDQEN